MGQLHPEPVDLAWLCDHSPIVVIVRCVDPPRSNEEIELTARRESDGSEGHVTVSVGLWHFERVRVLRGDAPACFRVIGADAEDYAVQIAEYELRGLDRSPVRRSYWSESLAELGPGQEVIAFLSPPEPEPRCDEQSWGRSLRAEFCCRFADCYRLFVDVGLESTDELAAVRRRISGPPRWWRRLFGA